MNRWRRRSLLIVLDAILVNLAYLGALFVRFEGFPAEHLDLYWRAMLFTTAVRILTNYFFGLYRRSWQYASIGELLAIVGAVSAGTMFNMALVFFFFQYVAPRSVLLIAWLLNIAFVGGIRFSWRVYRQRGQLLNSEPGTSNVMIVGAGDGGVLVARELRNHYGHRVSIVGFIDDDPLKKGQQILGCPVLGCKEDIPALVQEHKVDEIIISMPSVSRKVIREIVSIAQPTGKVIKILPGVFDLIDGNVTVQRIREVELEDLLGRDPVQADLAEIGAYLTNRVVLVTGAGGSIGSELCRQVLALKPEKLLLLDNCENNMYEIEMELRQWSEVPLVALVKDIRDRRAIEEIFDEYRPEVIFHAAAHKHVPLMELNPEEAIKNNVYGTYQVAWAAHRFGAKRFVLVSTDKAVNPTSVMGASKRIAEMVIQYLDTISETNYVAVRFGNVLGSRGSVIPLFKKQILAGGPVTVTHEKMIRYFMTIPEAVQLILQAGVLARGGEIFVLDMGDPVRILDLATTLIRLSGYEPYTEIDIKITGMRPGEKLFEELLTAEEGVNATTHERIFVARPTDLDTELLAQTVAAFAERHLGYLPKDQAATTRFIQAFLPEFVVVTNATEALAEVAVTSGGE